MQLFVHKLIGIPKRIHFAIIIFYTRLWRFFKHFTQIYSRRGGNSIFNHLSIWIIELVFLILDLTGIAEVYEIVIDIFKIRSRTLSEGEVDIAKSIFGNTIDYSRIRIDQRALLGPKQMRIAYVSFYTINTWGDLSIPLLIHELTHIWQYQKYGALYIPRALIAQRSNPSYDYGGLENLKRMKDSGETIESLNMEQQADLAEDYYLLISGEKAQWGTASIYDIGTYLHFIKQFQALGQL